MVIFSPGHSERGGIARRSRLFASELAARGWDTRVVAKSDDLHWFRTTRHPNLVVVEIPGFRSQALGALTFLTAGVVAGSIWGRRAAALLAVQLVSPTYAAAICSQLVRRPYIAFTSTSGQLSEVAYLINSRFSRVRSDLLRRAAFVAAQTAAAAEELKRIVDPERVAVVPNPVESVVAAPLTGHPRAIYTGRLSEEKDLLRLLDAWRIVAEPRAEAVLTLAGDGGRYRSVQTELRQRVGQDAVLARSVVFTGWVSDVGPLLASSDVYVFPSLTEGMSNALLEACAWGRVVVASDIPSNRAVLGDDYPLLFPAGDSEGLVEALNRALGDDHIRAAAVDRVLRRAKAFSLDVVVDEIEELVARSVAQCRRRR
ncbi:MAG: glycosyltransferase family 4 protein [Actinomycetota bacterium]|nr:glycosyltransferase family 4 protein [Actinomycetota bacterium]